MDPGTHVLFRLSFGFVSRSALVHVLLWERAVSSSLGPCAPLSACVVLFGTRFVFFVVLFCCTQLVFHCLRAFMFSPIRMGLVLPGDLQSFVIIEEIVCDLNPVRIGHVCNL